LEFINSGWYNQHERFIEVLKDDAFIKEYCEKWELPVPEFNDHSVTKLLHVRKELQRIALKVCHDQTLLPEDFDMINSYLSLGVYRQELVMENESFQINTIPKSSALDWLIYKIAFSFVDLIVHYRLDNLKECENPDCDWIFYDTSKNHSRKWCENKCASLIKVRRFREVQKEKNQQNKQ